MDGTYEWIKKNGLYNSWLRGETQLLWICGGPGKGKTILSIFLTQELERDKQTIYYFCRAGDERHNNATSVLRALLWHLTTKQPELTGYLLEFFDTLEKEQTTLSSREIFGTYL